MVLEEIRVAVQSGRTQVILTTHSPYFLNLLPLQPGDVPDTFADVKDLVSDTGYHPNTSVPEGVARFVAWYRDFYRV